MPPAIAVTVTEPSVWPSGIVIEPGATATVGWLVSNVTTWPPAWAGAASVTATVCVSPASTMTDGGMVTVIDEPMVSTTVAGPDRLPATSAARAESVTCDPACAEPGTMTGNWTVALFDGGETWRESASVKAPWPVRSTRTTAWSSDACATTVTVCPGSTLVVPSNVRSVTAGGVMSLTVSSTRAAVAVLSARSVAVPSRATVSPVLAVDATVKVNDVTTDVAPPSMGRVAERFAEPDAAKVTCFRPPGSPALRVTVTVWPGFTLSPVAAAGNRDGRRHGVEHGERDGGGRRGLSLRVDGAGLDLNGRTGRGVGGHVEPEARGAFEGGRRHLNRRGILGLSGLGAIAQRHKAHVVGRPQGHRDARAVAERGAGGRSCDGDGRRRVRRNGDRRGAPTAGRDCPRCRWRWR